MVRIKEWRKELGVTQKELAEAAGLNPRWIQKVESGEINIENVTVKKFAMLMKGLSDLADNVEEHEVFSTVRGASIAVRELLRAE